MPPLADLQKRYTAKKDDRTDIARIIQNLLGQGDGPGRFREVVNMSEPAFRVQNALGLVSPNQAESRRLSRRNPERTHEVQNMSDPAFAIQNLLGMVDPEDAKARNPVKRSTGKASGREELNNQVEGARYFGNGPRIMSKRDERVAGQNAFRDASIDAFYNEGGVTTATPADAIRSAEGQVTTATPADAIRPARRMARSVTPEEEAGILGAPGSGGIPDATHRGDPRLPPHADYEEPDPFGVNAAYDNYLGMIDDMSATYANLADTNMGRIADIFGEVSGVAQGGMAPLGESYDQAQGNVGGIYDSLDERLGGLSGELQGIAENAAGSATGDVASMVEANIAPFEAASATARANSQANLAQHSTAGQNYLSNLASASGEEGKMHATRLQAAADARQAEFDIRRMELEMSREEALREIAMDSAGQAAEREAMAALFGSAGIPLPPGMDMEGAQSYLNLGQDLGMFPTADGSGSEADALRAQLNPFASDFLESAVTTAENAWTQQGEETDELGQPVKGDRTQDFMFEALAALDDQLAQYKQNPYVLSPEMRAALEQEELLRQIIRNEYGKF